MFVCGVCGGRTSDLTLGATERMFGRGGTFRYERCAGCGCLQLADVPSDLASHYGDAYYSLGEPDVPSPGRSLYRRSRDAILFGRFRRLGFLAAPFLPARLGQQREWFRRTGVTERSRILDVGCGTGLLLRRLAQAGYALAEGVDPYLAHDVHFGGRLLVRRADLAQVEGAFDLVMFHHSLEHIGAQRATMSSVAALLAPGGRCLIRVPIVGTWAFETYRDRWVQLDAPRHLFLHSVRSLRRLAEDAGLALVDVVHDGTGFTFEGSELYRRDLPLATLTPETYRPSERREFERQAQRLNRSGQGDQACFYLRKS